MKKAPVLSRISGRIMRSRFLGRCLKTMGDRIVGIHSLNVGGGPDFRAIGWLNLDAAEGSGNPSPFALSPSCVFPLKDKSVRTVYTSHCLEHLDTPTVKRVLSESGRVLAAGGRLVVKLPDFDKILDAWKRGDAAMFADELWAYDTLTDTWKNRNIADCLDSRAAMLFCGFWNDAYGDPFSRKIIKSGAAYHGPPAVGVEFLRGLIRDHTPSQISAALCAVVTEKEKDYHFNHRNAWSRAELESLLNSAGFKVVTMDKNAVLKECADFPGISAMEEQSLYCLAVGA